MLGKVKAFIREHGMLETGDCVAAAVSGGPDSVCLLHLLTRLRQEFRLQLVAVHVHHGLRGAEADRDAEFVRRLAAGLDTPCVVVYENTAVYAARNKLSVEEAGRILRYRALRNQARLLSGGGRAARIAVAHQKEDQAETILHHLFRGSSLKGLAGMAPVSGDVIRPLLCAGRREILEYLREEGLGYCEDSTNGSDRYTRNRIRRLLPWICGEINSGAVDHILAAGEKMAQADAYFERQAEAVWERQGQRETGRLGLPVPVLSEQPRILGGYLVMRMIRELSGSLKDITSAHVEQVLDLAEKPTGRRVSLPGGMEAVREYRMLWLTAARGDAADRSGAPAVSARESASGTREPKTPGVPGRESASGAQAPKAPEATAREDAPAVREEEGAPGGDAAGFEFSRFLWEKNREIPREPYTKWFDCDKIKSALSVRTRRTGDYITLKGGGRKTVKAFMIDEKIPRRERDRILLLAEGSHVLWIVGYRISEYYKVTDQTREILQVRQADGREEHVGKDPGTAAGGESE